ncbi:nuclear transport factor 2 family protein [Vulcaniibacterium tengchongense]|uniref:Steroid delta-isomerase-like uncharacterized protein n=1 Tax=Vulcaniibacterium tengchongense TaxID=1273429 RepID=A0A3N4VK14_9GAMM|nr:nuclear transport factor 2 family protein [Vulcaniibacterium tengchongense]RPE80089.1 steroid delta-isomerase-like uncharacterized protein [Vulcaniibacterium tengchongense]
MNDANPANLIERYLAAYNAFDVDGMLALLRADVVFENYSGGVLTASARGIEEFRALAERAKALFVEREQRVTALRVDGDRAVAGIAYRGRLATDLPGGPAAGATIELQGESEFVFRDGRIARLVDRS